MHILENEALKISVADAGAELCGVVDKADGCERLWNADPAIWNRHAPILFPFVGKLTGGEYRIGGRAYAMKTQHGFARDMVFECVEAADSSVTHRLLPTDATRAIYPYEFSLLIRHSLDAADPRLLRIEWTVENHGTDTMYFSIGGHPGFLMPPGAEKEDCFVQFPGVDTLRYFSVNAQGYALPDQLKTLRLENGFAPYQTDIPDTWIFPDGLVQSAAIAGPDHRPYVTLNCEGFPLLAVWANPKGPFICLEPWFGRTDDEGFSGTLEDKAGMEKLAPGEKRHIAYSIRFHAAK